MTDAAVRWVDNHCHLPDGDAGDDLVAEALAGGVERLITVGCDVPGSVECARIADRHEGVWATAGVHPHDAAGGIDGLVDLLGLPKVVAVGECGLDYHYDHSPREAQREVFAAQIALAHEHQLPLVIHTREAWDDTFAILAEQGAPAHTVFHCFTGGAAEAERCLALGASLSFSGIVTFPSADDVREAAALCPLDRLLIETDSPYLAPVPHRGRKNRPVLVAVVGAAIALHKGLGEAEVAAATWHNAEAFYAL